MKQQYQGQIAANQVKGLRLKPLKSFELYTLLLKKKKANICLNKKKKEHIFLCLTYVIFRHKERVHL